MQMIKRQIIMSFWCIPSSHQTYTHEHSSFWLVNWNQRSRTGNNHLKYSKYLPTLAYCKALVFNVWKLKHAVGQVWKWISWPQSGSSSRTNCIFIQSEYNKKTNNLLYATCMFLLSCAWSAWSSWWGHHPEPDGDHMTFRDHSEPQHWHGETSVCGSVCSPGGQVRHQAGNKT